jgi:hypothetical protein
MLLLRVIDYPNIAAPVDGGFLGYKQDLVLRDNPSFPKWEIAVTHEPTRKIPTGSDITPLSPNSTSPVIG